MHTKTLLPIAAASALALGLGIAFSAAAPSASAMTPVAPAPATIVSAPAEAPRHAAFTRLLQDYVQLGSDGVTRVDYARWKANAADRAALDAYVERLAGSGIDGLPSEAARFAAWANLYNAVTLQHILDRYPVDSIRSGYLTGPWKRVSVLAEGRGGVSLDAIEHEILRPEFKDARVHYAVNCAAIGCPNLQTRAWEAATLDEDLDRAARAFVNDPRGVTLTDRGLVISRIYKWFEEDFGGSDAAVLAHLAEYAEPGLTARIEANSRIRRHRYDWSLNGAR